MSLPRDCARSELTLATLKSKWVLAMSWKENNCAAVFWHTSETRADAVDYGYQIWVCKLLVETSDLGERFRHQLAIYPFSHISIAMKFGKF